MEKNFCTAQTAQNATETVKTQIDSFMVPMGVTKLVEVGMQLNIPGCTTLEAIGAMLELECDDSSQWGGTQQFVSDTIAPLTGGVPVMPAKVHDCNIPVQPGSHIRFSTTFAQALTITPLVRCFGKFV